MPKELIAFATGVLFAVGLAISGMTDPGKVIGFLDFTGAWDPTLMFVMAGGIAVYAMGYRLAASRSAPLYAEKYSLPTATSLDARLITGAAVFGAGWGVAGFCPGPAVVSVVTGTSSVVAFVGAMLCGMLAHGLVMRRSELAAS